MVSTKHAYLLRVLDHVTSEKSACNMQRIHDAANAVQWARKLAGGRLSLRVV